jgi:hypothetical protein
MSGATSILVFVYRGWSFLIEDHLYYKDLSLLLKCKGKNIAEIKEEK